MTIRYQDIRESHAVGATALHSHCKLSVPVRQYRYLLLRYNEYDAARLTGLVRNDGAPKEVGANGNARGKTPRAAHRIAAIGAI